MNIIKCPCGSTSTSQHSSGPHIGLYCNSCGKWLQWLPQPIKDFIWPIGSKHKGKPILDILKIDKHYLEWAATTLSSPKLKAKAIEAIKTIDPTWIPPETQRPHSASQNTLEQGNNKWQTIKKTLLSPMVDNEDESVPW